MTFESSPVAYPTSSLAVQNNSHEKRKRPIQETGGLPPKRLFKLSPESIGILSEVEKTTRATDSAVSGQSILYGISNPFAEDDSEDESASFSKRSQGETAATSIATSPACPFTVDGIEDKSPSTKPRVSSVGFSNDSPDSNRTRICITSSGKARVLPHKQIQTSESYERIIAKRSTTDAGKATRSYYGIDIHTILQDAKDINVLKEAEASNPPEIAPSVEQEPEQPSHAKRKHKYPLWTEKYRARKFTDLVGDERTHRSVLHWLKHWDSIVFPGSAKPKMKKGIYENQEDGVHRKILMLTGPPGLGKTTLAHVCARQAGYEVVEINASDERSRDVVRGKIKDCVGTENVRGISTQVGDHTIRKAGRPVCVVVDEVDGVVSGSGGGGEGGFIKALIDLVLLDQKNTKMTPNQGNAPQKKKKGDRFRLLRPMILICNDVYHPSLRPLRSSGLAEIVHVRKPALEKIVTRMRLVFEKENIPADLDAVRRLCEATWGIASRKDRTANSASGEGDIRGILVVGQWVASRLRASRIGSECPRLTRSWLEQNILADLANGGSGARGIGRGGVKETVDRIFLEGGGFPKTAKKPAEDSIPSLAGDTLHGSESVTENARAHTVSLLRSAIEQCGEHDRIVSDLFTAYPTCSFQDDTFLTKPNIAYDWLHFHDSISSKVFSQQDWELSPYLSQAALSFHHLFASAKPSQWTSKDNEKEQEDENVLPFSGPRADFSYHETQKANLANLHALQNSLSVSLHRTFRSPQELATDLIPHLNRCLTPDVKPVLIGGSGEQRSTATVRRDAERERVRRAAEALAATGVSFERTRVEDESARASYAGFVYRMEPPVDILATFATAKQPTVTSRYAVRQVLDQGLTIFKNKQAANSRFARSGIAVPAVDSVPDNEDAENKGKPETAAAKTKPVMKRDFFGRVIVNEESAPSEQQTIGQKTGSVSSNDKGRVWVTFHEGFSNAVRKPITLRELMEGL